MSVHKGPAWERPLSRWCGSIVRWQQREVPKQCFTMVSTSTRYSNKVVGFFQGLPSMQSCVVLIFKSGLRLQARCEAVVGPTSAERHPRRARACYRVGIASSGQAVG